jgi:type IV secretory pathway VirB9-like protein
MNSYQLLTRLLKEQCIVERVDTHTTQVSVKANKDVPSDSLQNPSDPDAGYDGHKGKGYQVQVAESYSTSEDTNMLNLITSVIVEPAHKHDAHATIPLIESTENLDLKPEAVLADTPMVATRTARRQRPWELKSFPRSWANSEKTVCRSRHSP